MGSSISRFTKISIILFLLTLSLRLSAQVTAGFAIIAPVPNCNPAVYSFVNSSTGTPPLSYQWNFGVYPGINSVFQNPSTTYIGCGTFTIKLIVTDGTGAVDSTTQDVTVQCSPSANFTTGTLSGCIPFNAGLNSTSTPGSGVIADYLWDFGDGYTGSGIDPNHTYTQTGCKNITLIVTNSFACVADTTITNVLCTYNPPAAGFTSSPASSCSAPFNVTYQDTSNSGLAPYTYQWIFEGGTHAASDSANPTVTYNSAGSFSTSLITTDADGCSDTIVKPGYVNIANNTANFTLSSVNGCAPASISAGGISSSTPIGWSWTVSPSATITNPTSQNTSFRFADTGTYTICLTINYGSGCTAQKCSTVVIHTAPTANFGISGLLNTCVKPNQITFTDSSTGSNLTYSWAFGGGSPASADSSSPPPITYSSCGNYSATLTVSDDFGCTATHTATNFLTIYCPTALFTVAPRGGCTPLSAQFNSAGSTGNPTSWVWDFGDPSSGSADTSNAQNPGHSYANPGCYTVSLTTTNAEGCTASYTLPQAVCTGNKPTASFNAEPGVNCANMPFSFINTSTGVDSTSIYTWDFTHTPPNFNNDSHQKDPNYIYEDTGVFNVSLIISNYGCNDTIVMDNAVRVLPPVAKPQVTHSCSNHFVVTLSGTTSQGADSYLWNIPGGNPSTATTPTVSVTYTATGNYTASLFVVNDSTACTDLESINIPIRDVHANFNGSPLSGCAPLSTCMSNSSVDAASYNWFLTNSSGTLIFSSSSTNPCFSLTTAGVYSVKLVATDMFGCKDTLYRPNYVTVYKPAANFVGAPLNGCVPLNVAFTDMSSAVTSTVTGWNWNFGDPPSGANNTSTLQNPSHTYNQDGYYTVTLTVSDNHGCTNTLTRTNYVHANQPHAAFNATSTVICQGTQECFNNASTGTGLNYVWNFGDGGTSTATNPCHLFDSTGTFTIVLSVTDATGCKDTAVKTNYIQVTMPHAGFAADTTNTSCPPLQVQFSNLSSDTDAHTTYFWEFGDGQTSSAPDPKHIYNIAGNFTVTLIVTNQNGCKDTLTFPNYIRIGGPTAYISVPPTSGCVPHYTCLRAVSLSTISFTWNFGDGTVQPGSDSICYTYNRTGSFFPELILNDGVGCIYAMPVGEITISGAVAAFTMDNPSLCKDGTVHFADSSYGTSAIASRTWDFGDTASGANNTSTHKHPSHFYATSGTYIVTLNITTVDSCTNSIQKTVTVYPAPSVAFSSSDSSACPPDSIFFTDLTSSASPIVSRLWDFGDTASGTADTSTLANPAHNYTTAGTFTVTLTELAADGCSDNATLPIVVHSAVTANAVSPVSVCIGGSMLLSASGGANYSWTPATGLNNTSIADPIASPTITTTYTVVVTSVFGCSGMDSVVVNVNPVPVITSINATADTCGVHGAMAVITVNSGTPGYSYVWNTSPAQTDSIATGLAGGSTYNVVVTDINGCTAVNNIPITNLPAPIVSITGTPTTCGYSNGTVTANVTAVNLPYTYNWADGPSTQGLSNIAAGNYAITVTDNFGCTGIANKTITNIPGPSVVPSVTNATCGIDNGQVHLTTSGGTHPFHYIWSNGATTKNISNLTGGTYAVTITDANNCTATTIDSLIVIPPPVLTFTQVDASCGKYNGSINVTITGGTAPYLYNWNNGKYSTEDLTNIHSGTYHVVMTDANGCTDTATVVIGDTPFPILNFAYTPSTCNQSNGAIDLTVTNGVPPYTYTWNTGATTEDISGIPSGSYHIIVNSANGCFADTNVSLNDLTGAALTITPHNNTCGLVNGAVNLSLTGGTSPFTYNWSDGSTTQNISALNTGIYLVTVTDGNGCQTQSNTTLVNIPGPTLSIYPARATCGLPNGSINLVLSGGTAPFIYNWSNGTTTQDIANVLSGQYAVTVTDANACMDSSSAIITNVDGPTLSGNTIASTCGNGNGAISLIVNSGTSPFTFSWNSGAYTTQDLTNIPSGNYNALVTDSNLCIATLNLVVSNIAGPTPSLTETNSTCGNSNGSINLNLSGGTGPFTYNWNNGAYTTQNISNLSIGNYTVAVTDSNNCVAIDSIVVNNTAGPTLDTVITNAACGNDNGVIQLIVTGGTSPYIFTWNVEATTQTISWLAPGLYNATVTDGNGCQTSISAIVSNIPAPSSFTTSVSSFCGNSNGAVNLNVSGGTPPFTFNWSNTATLQNIASLSAGTYYVTITDANGCQITDSAIVNNISGPTASASTINSSCGNSNGQVYSIIIGGTGPFTYQWNTGDSTQDLNYIAAGNYSLSVTDANGCSSTTSAVVSNINGPSALIISATQSTCGNANALATATVSGGQPPYQYEWNTTPAQATDTAFNLTGGNNYSLTVTDANNCSIVNSVSVTNIAGPSLSSTHANCTCAKFNGTINLTVSSGTSPYLFNWNNGATDQNLSGLSPAIYSVTITDANGCTDTTSVDVQNIYGPYASHIATNTTCGNTNGSVNETISGGTFPFYYNWNNNTFATQDLSGIAAGKYVLQLTDAAGCLVSDSVIVTNTPGPALTMNSVPGTCGNSNGTALVKLNGGTAPFTYLWNNFTSSTDSFINSLAAGTYTVSVTDSNNCISTGNVVVTNTAGPTVRATAINATCGLNNGSISLAITGGTPPFTFNWNSGLDTTQNISGLAPATYFSAITDANGCNAFTANVLHGSAAATLNITSNEATCGLNNGFISVTTSGGTAPYTYNWNTGATTSSLSNLAGGTYILQFTEASGCMQTDSVVLTSSNNSPVVTAVPTQPTICTGGSTTITANGASSYTWTPSTGLSATTGATVTAHPAVTTTYTVTGSVTGGCADTITVVVAIQAPPAVVAVSANPNVCSGTSTTLSASGAITYKWTPGATLSSSTGSVVTSTPSSNITYTVTGKDNLGCTANTTVSLTKLANPVIQVAPDNPILCNGNSVLMTATGTTNYTWSPGFGLSQTTGASVTASPTVTTTYTIIGTNAQGCADTALEIISAANPAPVNAGPDGTICPGGSYTLQGSGAIQYQWSPATGLNNSTSANPIASPSVTTTYYLHGYVPTGQLITNGDFSAGNTGFTSGYTYATDLVPEGLYWVGPTPHTVHPNFFCNDHTTGSGNLMAVNGAPNPGVSIWCESINVVPNSLYDFSTWLETISPAGNPALLQFSINGVPLGSPFQASPTMCDWQQYSNTWNSGSNTTADICIVNQNTIRNGNDFALDDISFSVLCDSYDTVVVTVNPAPVITVSGSNNICKGSSSALTASGAATYSWKPATGLSATTGASVTTSATATTTYTITGTDVNGCTGNTIFVLTVLPKPSITINSSTPSFCSGGNSTLNASGANTYSWTPAAGLNTTSGATVTATNTVTTAYIVTGTDVNGCSATSPSVVTVYPLPNLTVSPASTTICQGSTTNLTASGAITYKWSPDSAISTTSGASVSVNPTISTTYTVIGIGTHGCTAQTNAPVVISTGLTLTITPNNPGICPGGSDTIKAVGATNYNWSPAFGLNNTTGQSVVANPTTTTSYFVTGTDASGCSGSGTAVVHVYHSPMISVSPASTSLCQGDSTLLVASGGVYYAWSPVVDSISTDSAMVKPAASTTYTVTGIDLSGCTASVNVPVGISPLPVMNVTAGSNFICFGQNTTLTASGADSYVWTPAGTLNSPTGPSVSAFPTVNTTYTVTGTSIMGCVATDSIGVTVGTPVTIGVDPVNPTICAGSVMTLHAFGAKTYQWSPSTGLSATTGSSVVASPTISTTYTIIGYDSSGCMGFNAIVVNIGTFISLTLHTSAPAICQGDTATLTVSGALNYNWSPVTSLSDSTGSSVLASPAGSTVYNVTGIDAVGCTGSGSVSLTVNPLPTIVATPDSVLTCSGSSALLTATGGVSYNWTPSSYLNSLTGDSVIATPLSNLIYFVTGTDANGCKNKDSVLVVIKHGSPISVTPIADTLCSGQSTILTASGAISYTWTPASGLNTTTGDVVVATPLVTTKYFVTGTDSGGCQSVDSSIIIVHSVPVITATNNLTICTGTSATLTASGAEVYSWSPATGLSATTGSTVTADPGTNITYIIIGTDTSGCSNFTTASITIGSGLSITINPDTVAICQGGSAILTANGAANYNWSPATGLNATTGASVTANPTVTTTYTIVGTDAGGCSGDTTFVVTVRPLPIVNVNNATICSGNSTALIASGTSTYSWLPNSNINSSTGDSVIANPTTTTTYTVTGIDLFGCSSTSNSIVNVNPLPIVDLEGLGGTVCLSASPIELSVLPSGGVFAGPGLYGDTFYPDSAGVGGPDTVTYTYTNTFGCSASTFLTVTVSPNPDVQLVTNSPVICPGNSAILTVTGAQFYNWVPVGTFLGGADSMLVTPSSTTMYYVRGTDTLGCSALDSALIRVNTIPVISINGLKPAYCLNASADTLSGIPAGGIFSGVGIIGNVFNPSLAGVGVHTIYYVYADSIGCGGEDSVQVTVDSLPVISAISAIICAGSSTALNANGAASYNWMPGNLTGSNITVNPLVNSTYTVTGINAEGCSSTSTSVVTVNPLPVVSFNGLNPNYCSAASSVSLNGLPAGGTFSGLGVSGNNFNPSSVAIGKPDTITYSYTDSLGCSNLTNQIVNIHNGATIIASPVSTTICPGTSTVLNVSGGVSYTWSPATGLSATTGSTVIANPSVNSTYIVSGTDVNGCTGSDTVTVSIGSNLTIQISAGNNSICKGASTILTTNGATQYTWSPNVGLSNSTGTTITVSPSVTTTYTVTGSIAGGCSGDGTIVITVNNAPTITANNTNICKGSTATLIAGGGTSYSWVPGNLSGDSIQVSPTTNITFTIIGKDANGCSNSANAIVTINPLPVVSFSGLNPGYCSSASPVTLIGNPAGGTFSGTGVIGNTFNPAIIAISHPDTVTYSYTNGSGCSNMTSQQVIVHNNASVAATPVIGNICSGSSTGLSASGAVRYFWAPPTGLSRDTGAQISASPSVSTTYTVTGTDANGCTGQAMAAVLLNNSLSLNLSSNNPVICVGATANLTVSGATTYAWAPNIGLSSTTGASVKAAPAGTTTYTITGFDAGGCTGTGIVIVTVNPLPIISAISTVRSVCYNSSANLIVTGATNYIWAPANSLSASSGSNVIASPVSNTTYTVTGTNASGCSSSDTVAILVRAPLTLTISNPVATICEGNTVSLNVSGASSYKWSPRLGLNASTGATVNSSPIFSVTYTITGTDTNGCTAKSTAQVFVNPIPGINAFSSSTAVCTSNTDTLNVSGALNYSWAPSTGLNSATGNKVIANPSLSITYTVTAIDSNGCSNFTQLPVIVNPLPVVNINPTNPIICGNSSVPLNVSGAASYSWYPAVGLSASTGSTVQASPAYTSTYTIIGTDANGCSAGATTLVTVGGKIKLNVSPPNPNVCAGQSSVLTASGAVYYTWSPAIGLNTTTGSTVIATPPASITYVLTGYNGACMDSISIPLIIRDNPVVVAGPDAIICAGSGTTLNAIGNGAYSWSPANSLNAGNIPNPYASPAQTTVYVVTVTNNDGCHASDTITVYVHNRPVANAGNDTLVCLGGSTVLHGSDGTSYSWSPKDFLNDPQSSSPICVPTRNITYTLTVIDSFGCSNQDSVQIFVKMPFNINASPGGSICYGGVVQLQATGGFSYQWSPPTGLDNPYVADPFASPGVTTTYTVTSFDGVCFYSSDTVVVTVNELPYLDVSLNAEVTYGQNIQLQAYGTGDLTWSPPDFLTCTDCPDPYVEHISHSMTYVVTETSASGCRAEDTIHISLACGDDGLYVPDAFTPNGDNKNDIFRVRAYGIQHISYFRVFNRWGEMVFETTDINQGWDGTYKGQPCSPAVFDWYLEGTCSSGQEVLKKGNVTLIR